MGTDRCSCAAPWRGRQAERWPEPATIREKTSPLGTALMLRKTDPIKSSLLCENSGMERAASPLRTGWSSGNWHAGEAEHLYAGRQHLPLRSKCVYLQSSRQCLWLRKGVNLIGFKSLADNYSLLSLPPLLMPSCPRYGIPSSDYKRMQRYD